MQSMTIKICMKWWIKKEIEIVNKVKRDINRDSK